MEEYLDICNEIRELRKDFNAFSASHTTYSAMMLKLKQLELGMISQNDALGDMADMVEAYKKALDRIGDSQ